MSNEPAVEVVDLVKRYPKAPVNAVDGLSFQVEPGEIFGLLGPNGAGKTTTMGVLTTRVRATSGTARVAGIDVARNPVAARARLSVVSQRPNIDFTLSARQNLVFHAAYHGVPAGERKRRADALLATFGLAEHAKRSPHNFSGGQTQRLLIARALMHGPEVLFLDEPSTGLDPQARLFVWDRVRELRAAGVTVVITTHDMDEAAQLTDRVGIVDHGTLLALDTPGALTRSLPGSTTLDLTVEYAERDDAEAVTAALSAVDGVERVERVTLAPAGMDFAMAGGGFPGGGPPGPPPGGPTPGDGGPPADGDRSLRVRLYLTGEGAARIAPVTQVLVARDARLTAVSLGEPSLEDVFINLTGRDLR